MLYPSLRHWFFLASFVPFGVAACAENARCGDGVVDADETCDDGNSQNGDGCSAACEPDDDLTTVGDDRAGYVQCAPPAPGEPNLVCGPGLGCCPEGCAPSGQDCQSPFGFVSCDGDEDCASAEQHCWVYKTTGCSTEDVGYSLRCHRDQDCPGPVFECRNGNCPMFSDPPTP